MQKQLMDEARRQLQQLEEGQQWFTDNESEIERINEQLEVFDDFLISAYVDFTGRSVDLSYAGDKALFNDLFSVLRKLGYEPNSRPENDIAVFNTFWKNSERNLSLWMMFSSTVCKRIKVGTKMVETDVYEIMCE